MTILQTILTSMVTLAVFAVPLQVGCCLLRTHWVQQDHMAHACCVTHHIGTAAWSTLEAAPKPVLQQRCTQCGKDNLTHHHPNLDGKRIASEPAEHLANLVSPPLITHQQVWLNQANRSSALSDMVTAVSSLLALNCQFRI